MRDPGPTMHSSLSTLSTQSPSYTIIKIENAWKRWARCVNSCFHRSHYTVNCIHMFDALFRVNFHYDLLLPFGSISFLLLFFLSSRLVSHLVFVRPFNLTELYTRARYRGACVGVWLLLFNPIGNSLPLPSWSRNWFAHTYRTVARSAYSLYGRCASANLRNVYFINFSLFLFYFMISLFSAVYFSSAHKIRIQCMNEKLDLTLCSVRLI